ncbi:MAG: lysine 2,3-aminomutase, partial [Actinobacteria bacterium]|nr:lysine 2,3-aminomutase [Actinomycetota bacterium]
MRNYKEMPLWANISPEEWNDWKWQLNNRIMSVDDLSRAVNLTSKEIKEMKEWEKYLRIAITPY